MINKRRHRKSSGKQKFIIIHVLETGGMPHRATWESLNLIKVRRQKAGVRGRSRPELLLGFPWERQGQAE